MLFVYGQDGPVQLAPVPVSIHIQYPIVRLASRHRLSWVQHSSEQYGRTLYWALEVNGSVLKYQGISKFLFLQDSL